MSRIFGLMPFASSKIATRNAVIKQRGWVTSTRNLPLPSPGLGNPEDNSEPSIFATDTLYRSDEDFCKIPGAHGTHRRRFLLLSLFPENVNRARDSALTRDMWFVRGDDIKAIGPQNDAQWPTSPCSFIYGHFIAKKAQSERRHFRIEEGVV